MIDQTEESNFSHMSWRHVSAMRRHKMQVKNCAILNDYIDYICFHNIDLKILITRMFLQHVDGRRNPHNFQYC